MSKKRNKKILVLVIIIVLICSVAGGLYVQLIGPKMQLKKKLQEIKQNDLYYDLDITVDGIDIPIFGEHMEGKLHGRKYEDCLYGELSMQEVAYLKAYMEKDHDIMIDVKPYVESVLDEIGESTGFPVKKLFQKTGELNISLSQVEEITGKQAADFREKLEELYLFLASDDSENAAWLLKRQKKPGEEHELLGKDVNYYSISMEGKELEIWFGIPKNQNDARISLEINRGNEHCTLVGSYEIAVVEPVEIPESSIDENWITILKMIYPMLQKKTSPAQTKLVL